MSFKFGICIQELQDVFSECLSSILQIFIRNFLNDYAVLAQKNDLP